MTEEKPHLKVVELNPSNFRDIPATLRVIAEQIERGEYGNIADCALVIQGAVFEVFHMGEGDIEVSHLMFACAQRKMELSMIAHYGG